MAPIKPSSDYYLLRARIVDLEAEVERLRATLASRQLHAERQRAEVERLRSAIEEYRLWRPGEKGHAAAHRKLMEALDE